DVVLLAGAHRHALGGDRGGGGAERGDAAGGGVLGDHQPAVHPRVGAQEGGQPAGPCRVEEAVDPPLADGGEVGAERGEHVGGVGEPLAVEVPGAHHLAAVDEHQRVVDDRGELALDGGAGDGAEVAGGAVHLGRAAQRVGVLHGVVGGAVRRHQRAAGE